MEEKKTELKMIKMSEVQSQEIEWLWYPFIPYGKLTIVQGDPGDGKTTLILNIAAKLSKGEGLDNDMKLMESMNIIYQTAEDGLADTVKPRLEKAGADCERILIIDESDKSLSMADERLEEAIPCFLALRRSSDNPALPVLRYEKRPAPSHACH